MQGAVLVFQQRPYSFLTGNCHSFVAHTLNAAAFEGSRSWSAVSLTQCMLWRGRSVSFAGFAKQWVPFALIMGLGWYFLGVLFLVGWLACALVVAGWFVGYGCFCREGSDVAELPHSSGLHQAYSV